MSWKASSYVKRLSHGPSGELLTRSEKLVLLILADYYSDKDGVAWPSVTTVAKDAMLSERRARQVIHNLEKKGSISIDPRRPLAGPQPNIYRITGLGAMAVEVEGPNGASQCSACGWAGPCDIHHKTPLSQGGTEDDENRIILCPNCHRLVHAFGMGAIASGGNDFMGKQYQGGNRRIRRRAAGGGEISHS